MAVVEPTYLPSSFGFSGHLETIVPALLRQAKVNYTRERITLSDGDFIDIDRIINHSNKILILFHGLEGSSASQYIQGFAKHFSALGWDICAMNFRSCSGEMNRKIISYHSGKTDDVAALIQKIAAEKTYHKIALAGFSLGGNVLLKYLSEYKDTLPSTIFAAIGISVPVNLADSAITMSKPENYFYMRRFLKSLGKKMLAKSIQFPGKIKMNQYHQIKTFHEFDNQYTAPIHGFKDANDYYHQCSAIRFLPEIKVPTLLLNAKNDPFLGAECYPNTPIKNHPFVTAEYPKTGGHVGFAQKFRTGIYYSETRAETFFQEHFF